MNNHNTGTAQQQEASNNENQSTSYTTATTSIRTDNGHDLNVYVGEEASSIVKYMDFTGYCAIVVGSNRGIGLEIVKTLASRYCHVIMACRSLSKAHESIASILKDQVMKYKSVFYLLIFK